MDAARAAELEAADPLPTLREEFLVPPWPDGTTPEWAYLAGNSLGLQPKAAQTEIEAELDEWARLGVEGWFEARKPWLEYAGSLRASIGRLVGASAEEVAAMNTLTVNLHLLLASFYRPTGQRFRLLIEDTAFPSDLYALQSQAVWHGLDPAEAVVRVPLDGIADAIGDAADSLALALLPAVNYLDGRVLDVAALTEEVHAVGAVAAWDLAHAVGNVSVSLHDADVDFAVWCHYKYVNAGPGAPGFLYVAASLSGVLRSPVQGWFGQRDQFLMGRDYEPAPDIGRFLAGTPDIAGTAAVEEGVRLLAEAGIGRLRDKGMRLTDYLIALAGEWLTPLGCTLASPRDAAHRGSHVCLRHPEAWRIGRALIRAGVIGDYRTPDRLRLGPAPITTAFTDVWDALDTTRQIIENKSYQDFPPEPARVT